MALSKEEIRESIKVTNPVGIAEQLAVTEPDVTEETPAQEEIEAEPVAETASTETETEVEPEPEAEEEERIPKSVMLKRLAAKNAEIARLQAAAQPAPSDAPLTQEDVDRLADQKASARLFDRDCDRLAAAASKLDPKFMSLWTETVDPAVGLGPPPRELLEAFVEFDEPQLLTALAKDSTKLEQLYSLRGAKLGVALAKISEEIKKPKPKPVSKAPAPIEPVGGGNRTPGVLRDDMPMEQWVALRQKQKRAPNYK